MKMYVPFYYENKETVVANGNKYSYTTKRGLLKKYIGLNSFKEYKCSELYPNKNK